MAKDVNEYDTSVLTPLHIYIDALITKSSKNLKGETIA